jgi:sugar O-acyltransferase (sialic acid O-acetyltransferase NeuD family)
MGVLKQLLIVGAGGFGREMYAAAVEAVGYGSEFTVKGFLDGRADALEGFPGYPPVIGRPEDYSIGENDVFITALGNIAARRRCVAMIESRGGVFVPVVHRTASLGPNVKLGAGAFVAHNAVLTADIEIGRHACVFHGSVIGHDSRLGDFSHVYSLVSVGGSVEIGEGASVFPGARIVPRRRIGAGATVGIGSVAVRDVDPGVTVFGVPAEKIDFS